MTGATWHILGPGAIGSLFAWKMAAAGFEPILISRSPKSRPVNLQFQPFASDKLLSRPFTVDDGATPISYLLVTVKAHQTEAALASLQHRIDAGTTLLLLQNGMGTLEIAQRICPQSVCLAGTTTEGAYRTDTGSIIHAGLGSTWIGALQPEHLDKAKWISQSWQGLDLEINFDPHIHQRLWEKLAINCAINPLTMIYNCKNGKLLDIPQAQREMRELCAEVEAVKAGALKQKPATGQLFKLVKTVAEKTSGNLSSMLQDARAGRTTEINFITGYLIQQADRLGIRAEKNREILIRLGMNPDK